MTPEQGGSVSACVKSILHSVIFRRVGVATSVPSQRDTF